MVTIKAPAKINLTLEVLRRRQDGYREIRSVLQTIDLCDTLHIEAGKGITFKCDMPGWQSKYSLLNKTVELIRKVTKCKEGAAVTLEKRIPLLSGLGGDSSGAAALLKGLNELWGLNLANEKLLELAAKLGSDVPFFLRGGTALAEGRGEIIFPLPTLPKTWILLIFPGSNVDFYKTARMYSRLQPMHYTDGSKTDKLVAAIKEGKPLDISMLFNVFKDIAFHTYIGLISCDVCLLKAGIYEAYLAGTGPTLFAVFQDKNQAEDILNKCKEQGLNTALAATL